MKDYGYIVIGLCILGLAVFMRFEGFQSGAGSNTPTVSQLYPDPRPVRATEKGCDGNVVMEYSVGGPSAKRSIKDVDDYEYLAVSDNENDRALSMAMRNKLMSQRPFEWAGLPPSASQFLAGLRESFTNANETVPDDAKPYQDVNGGAMAPPDTTAAEMRERQTLQTYVPKRPSESMTTYDVEDADRLIRKIYDEKGLIPTVAHKNGTNVYEIVGVRKKDEKILYEDEEAPAMKGPVEKAGEATIHVPSAAYDMAAARDPYYNTAPGGAKTRMGKWDFQAWTPGLERMFAPTEPKLNWY
jgi:hypothetical protein